MRSEFIPLSADHREVAAYRDAILKAGVGIETTAEALESACRRVTHEHACIMSDMVAAYPQVVNMIVHGGFEDERGRTLLVLPRDIDAFRIVRDTLADSQTSIAGFATRYVEVGLVAAIEATAAKLGMPLGPRSAITLPGWYTIFPTSGDDAKGRRREARPAFERSGAIAGSHGGKSGHVSGDVPKDRVHAIIDIPDPERMGLPGPCFLDAYLGDDTAVAEVKPGLARVYADRCYLERAPHEHRWKSFWVYVPDYSDRRWCALLTGERCMGSVTFTRGKRGKQEKLSCPATRRVKASRVSLAVLEPQPPAGWKVRGGLEPQKGHAHLWHKEEVHWSGRSVFRTEFFYCPLCDAEAWPTSVDLEPTAYMNYGPAIDQIAKSVRFPADVRSAFTEDPEQRGSYMALGAWSETPTGIQKVFKTAVAKAESKFSDEIKAFKEETKKLKRKAHLSAFLEASESVAKAHGRRWKAPDWVVDAIEQDSDDEADEASEDE